MAGETMSYPLRYGYSMVGRVAKCGQGVDASKILGKLVFTFSPHSSWVVADAGGVMLVPEVGRDRVLVATPGVDFCVIRLALLLKPGGTDLFFRLMPPSR